MQKSGAAGAVALRAMDGNIVHTTARRRLMIALDWDSLGLPGHALNLVSAAVIDTVRERLGSDWAVCMYRIYFSSRSSDAAYWHERYRSAGEIERWRKPKHSGRRGWQNWDFRIRKDALDWCARDPQSAPFSTDFVLVSNGGDHLETLQELRDAGVRATLIHTGGVERRLLHAFDANDAVKVRLE